MSNQNIPVMTGKVNSGPEKLDSVKLLDPGFHPARLYSIVDLGKQHYSTYNKWTPKIEFVFEFPGLRQRFYEDDTEERPTVASQMFTVSMGKKSNLRPFVENMLGKRFSDKEAESFNIFSLVDKMYLIQINHSDPDKDGNVYANIVGASVFQQNMAQGVDLTPYNDVALFHIPTHGFNSPEFGNLPRFKRERIMESEEAIEHKKAGGTFAEPDQTQNSASTAQPPQKPGAGPQAPAAANQEPQFVMIDKEFTEEQYLANGWTRDLLVEHGKAKWVKPEPPAPAPNAPSSPQPPVSAPAGVPNNPVLNSVSGDSDDSDLDSMNI